MLFPKKGSVTGSLGIRKAEAGGGAPAFRGGTRGDCLGGGVCVNVTFLPHKCWKFKKKQQPSFLVSSKGQDGLKRHRSHAGGAVV